MAANPRYELIDHPADVGMRIFGQDLRELFSNAATGMFEILADLSNVKEVTEVIVEAKANGLEELLHEWLNELLYIYEVQDLIFKRFAVRKMSRQKISASCWGELRDPARHHISTEIKSVTYHQLSVEKTEQGWVAEVIFDL